MIPTERQEQIKLHQWCKLKKLVSFAIPNGGSRHKLEAINLKREGVTAGISDYVVMLPNKILFLELKRSRRLLKSGKLSVSHTKTSPEQLKFLQTITESFDYADGFVCYGCNSAIEYIESHLNS